jgi:hypothetical protein
MVNSMEMYIIYCTVLVEILVLCLISSLTYFLVFEPVFTHYAESSGFPALLSYLGGLSIGSPPPESSPSTGLQFSGLINANGIPIMGLRELRVVYKTYLAIGIGVNVNIVADWMGDKHKAFQVGTWQILE